MCKQNLAIFVCVRCMRTHEDIQMCVIHPCGDMTEAMPSIKELLGGPWYVDMWEAWYVLPIGRIQHLNLFIPCIYGSLFIIFLILVVCRATLLLSPGDADDFLKTVMHRYLKEQDCKAEQAALFEEFAATEYTRNSRCIHTYKPHLPTWSV